MALHPWRAQPATRAANPWGATGGWMAMAVLMRQRYIHVEQPSAVDPKTTVEHRSIRFYHHSSSTIQIFCQPRKLPTIQICYHPLEVSSSIIHHPTIRRTTTEAVLLRHPTLVPSSEHMTSSWLAWCHHSLYMITMR